MAEVTQAARFSCRKLVGSGLLVAFVGWTGLSLGFTSDPRAAYFAYLVAFSFAASIALGALIFLMITYVVGAKWNIALRRLNESITGVFPALAVLFVPVALGVSEIYLWARPEPHLSEHQRHLLEHKAPYLNAPFFLLRSLLYFAIWIACAWLLRRWSFHADRAGTGTTAGDHHARERAFSAALLPLVGLALTFAAFDWLMSLQPFWFSTMFGVYYFAGGFVASFGLLSVMSFLVARRAAKGVIRPPHFHALGRLMFGFTIFWAYCAFFQAMLIQIANKPEEVEFYLIRLEQGWDYVAGFLLMGRFVLPFLLLLPRALKLRANWMAAFGSWLVFCHYVDIYWLVLPVLEVHGPVPNLWDLSALLAGSGSCVAFGAWRVSGRAVVPVGDPALASSIEYRSPL